MIRRPQVFRMVRRIITLIMIGPRTLFLGRHIMTGHIRLRTHHRHGQTRQTIRHRHRIMNFNRVNGLTHFNSTTDIQHVKLSSISMAFTRRALRVPTQRRPLTRNGQHTNRQHRFFRHFMIFTRRQLFSRRRFMQIRFLRRRLNRKFIRPTVRISTSTSIQPSHIARNDRVNRYRISFLRKVRRLRLFNTIRFRHDRAALSHFLNHTHHIN